MNSSDEAIEALCELSHEAYERAAAGAGWVTNPVSRVAWADVPEANKVAMRASVSAVAARVRAEAVAEERRRALLEAADEVHLELRWQAEQSLRSADSDLTTRDGFIERLGMVEQVLRDRAAGSVPVATTPEPDSRLALLGPARMVLDHCAMQENPTDPDSTEAGRMAQRIVDAIGHPVTDQHPVTGRARRFDQCDGACTAAPVATTVEPAGACRHGRVGGCGLDGIHESASPVPAEQPGER